MLLEQPLANPVGLLIVLDRLALSVADPTPPNSTNDINTHPLDYGDRMV